MIESLRTSNAPLARLPPTLVAPFDQCGVGGGVVRVLTQVHVTCEVVFGVLMGSEIHLDVFGVVDPREVEPALSRGGRATARMVGSPGTVGNGLEAR